MSDLPKTSLNIDFDETSECSYNIATEVETSPSPPNTKVYIRIYGSSSEKLQNINLYKEAQNLGSGNLKITKEDLSENIVFNDTVYAQTKYPIYSITDATAATALLAIKNKRLSIIHSSGTNLNVQRSGDICIKIAGNTESLYGSINLEYKAHRIYKEYIWTTPNITTTTEYPFFVVDTGEVVDTFNIKVEVQSDVIVDIQFVVSDIANDRPVKDAIVRITQPDNPSFIALEDTTNDNGEVIFSLVSGQTYDIKTTAEGFIDSDLDYISNDTFTVPVVEE